MEPILRLLLHRSREGDEEQLRSQLLDQLKLTAERWGLHLVKAIPPGYRRFVRVEFATAVIAPDTPKGREQAHRELYAYLLTLKGDQFFYHIACDPYPTCATNLEDGPSYPGA